MEHDVLLDLLNFRAWLQERRDEYMYGQGIRERLIMLDEIIDRLDSMLNALAISSERFAGQIRKRLKE